MPLMGQTPAFSATQVSMHSDRKEKARKRIVALIMLVYWLLIFEGILRKWVLPEFSKALFFIRDPFVLLIYILAFRHRMWPKMEGWFAAAVVITTVSTLIIPAQLLGAHYTTPLLAAYGWRNYFFYIPLAFIIRDCFRADDLTRMMKYTMLLSVPIALLVTLQFYSSPASWINIQSFEGIGGRQRPPGTFTSVVGQWMFVASLVAFLMHQWVSKPVDHNISWVIVLLATGAAFVCLGVSISRGMMIQSALIVLSAMFAGAIMRGGAATVRAWMFPAVIVVLGIVLLPILLPEAYETTVARWTSANAVESKFSQFGILGRALYGFIDFLSFIPVTPLLGFGMGLGGNASQQLEDVNLPIRAESEWSRNIVDLGSVFGICFILFRIILVITLGIKSIQATRRSGNPLPVILFGFIGVTLLNGQVTGHGSINGYTWVFVGLLMASLRWSVKRENP